MRVILPFILLISVLRVSKQIKISKRPSFRDEEVLWDNVRVLNDGETVSLAGTHLGHDLPDSSGNRYCINLVSVAGRPLEAEEE